MSTKVYTINNRPKKLRLGSKVMFVVDEIAYRYTVCSSDLEYTGPSFHYNDIVLKKLLVTRVEIIEFASKCYGYGAGIPGDWPNYTSNDFAAATRMVNAIFDLINEINKCKTSENATQPQVPTTTHRVITEALRTVYVTSDAKTFLGLEDAKEHQVTVDFLDGLAHDLGIDKIVPSTAFMSKWSITRR